MNTMQHMKDPAAGMPPQLLAHMHLISKHRYPVITNPSLETIVGFLMEAPKIVRDIQPVQWQFLDAPSDGSLLLTWQPLEYLGTAFASDGYVWADAEQSFKSEVRGYTLEIVMHRSGYRATGEPVASHCRKRYRLLPGNPGLGLPTPDPALWIVHYTRAASRDHIPAASIPLPPAVQASLQQRRAIQTQGHLARKEFMLHDRANWPVINLPQVMAGRSQAGPLVPGGTHRRGPSMNTPAVDPTIEEEEDVSRGDALDLVTPREISRMRYEQHHEWMEEILESAYNIKQIVPTDLGLGRKGELESLTRGFFEAPTSASHEPSANEAPARVGKMDPGKAEDFAKMAAQKVVEMQAELEALKQKHARRMQKLQKISVLSAAEKRLRTAASDAEDRPAEGNAAGEGSAHPAQASGETTDDIVRDVESAWSRKIDRVQNVALVQKGGLEEPSPITGINSGARTMSGASPTKSFSGVTFAQSTPGSDMNMAAPTQQHLSQPSQVPEQTSRPRLSAPEALMTTTANQTATSSTVSGAPSATEQSAPTSQDGMDAIVDSGADVDMAGLDDQNETPGGVLENSDWVMVDENGSKSPEDLQTDHELRDERLPAEQTLTGDLQPADAIVAGGVEPSTAEQTVEELPLITEDPGMDLQDEFDNVEDDTAGDALAQYGGDGDDLDLDTMDDSAFADAFHQDDSNDMDDEEIS